MAKGTVLAFTPQSDNEAGCTNTYVPSQGDLVPVYLGSVDLGWPYFLDFGVDIVRMLFMSWCATQRHAAKGVLTPEIRR